MRHFAARLSALAIGCAHMDAHVCFAAGHRVAQLDAFAIERLRADEYR